MDKKETDKFFDIISEQNNTFNYKKLEEFYYPFKVCWQLKNHFFENIKTAYIHWFFIQGIEAIKHQLFLPAVLSFLNGIESSLRIEMAYIKRKETSQDDCSLVEELDRKAILNNGLIAEANDLGFPVATLAFPDEKEYFIKKVKSKERVKLVDVRNDICHGNILKWVDKKYCNEDYLFTPELLIPLLKTLLWISYNWVEELRNFKNLKNS